MGTLVFNTNQTSQNIQCIIKKESNVKEAEEQAAREAAAEARAERAAEKAKEREAKRDAAAAKKKAAKERSAEVRENFVEKCRLHHEKINRMSAAQKQKYYAKNAKKAVATRAKKLKAIQGDLLFPVKHFRKRLMKTFHMKKSKVRMEAAIFTAAAIEYLVAELAELGGECAIQHKKKRIVPRHLLMAIQNDAEFSKLWRQGTMQMRSAGRGVEVPVKPWLLKTNVPRKDWGDAVEKN